MREGFMEDVDRPWTASESLADLTLFRDWDYMSSMVASLRTHLFEYGTVPTWNYLVCGGRPELSIPGSWAYVWPSLFAYALPPNHALIAVWVVMSLAGFFALQALLRDWTGHRLAASLGASLFVFNGFFAARFNPGHVPFAFVHLVPVMLLLFERGFASSLEGALSRRRLVLGVVVAWLFFTAGLPHALMYAYPAFLLLVAVRVVSAARVRSWRASLRAATPLALSHLLGLWLAAYKLWPVVRWQIDSPRSGVRIEAHAPGKVLSNTLELVPDFFDFGSLQAGSWPPWEHAAFVGPLPWLLAALAACAALARRWARRRGASSRAGCRGTGFALLLLVIGFDLSLGNGSAWSVARLFTSIPLLDGIRVFPRYQILVLLGLSILSASGFAILQQSLASTPARRAAAIGIALATAAPALLQAFLLVWNVEASPHTALVRRYPSPKGATPQLVGVTSTGGPRAGHATALMARGFWIANCREDLAFPFPILLLPPRSVAPLSEPAPLAVRELGHDSLTLAYAERLEGSVRLALPFAASFESSVPPERVERGRASFAARDLRGGELRISARPAGREAGAWATLAGLAAAVAYLRRHRNGSRTSDPA
jgi:hypothetical protein